MVTKFEKIQNLDNHFERIFRDYSSTPAKQISADTCMQMKTGDCYNYCPVYCGSNEKICSGKYFKKMN